MPDKSPNCWLVIAKSLFIVNAAKPMLFRSSIAVMNRRKTNGMIRVRTLRIAVASIALGTAVAVAAMLDEPHGAVMTRGGHCPAITDEKVAPTPLKDSAQV